MKNVPEKPYSSHHQTARPIRGLPPSSSKGNRSHGTFPETSRLLLTIAVIGLALHRVPRFHSRSETFSAFHYHHEASTGVGVYFGKHPMFGWRASSSDARRRRRRSERGPRGEQDSLTEHGELARQCWSEHRDWYSSLLPLITQVEEKELHTPLSYSSSSTTLTCLP